MEKPAKNRRLCSYNKQWEVKNAWIKPVSGDSTKAFCTLCRRELSVGHGGENDLNQHASTEMHKKAKLAKGASNIGAFFGGTTVETDKIAASDASYVYHTVKHGLQQHRLSC